MTAPFFKRLFLCRPWRLSSLCNVFFFWVIFKPTMAGLFNCRAKLCRIFHHLNPLHPWLFFFAAPAGALLCLFFILIKKSLRATYFPCRCVEMDALLPFQRCSSGCSSLPFFILIKKSLRATYFPCRCVEMDALLPFQRCSSGCSSLPFFILIKKSLRATYFPCRCVEMDALLPFQRCSSGCSSLPFFILIKKSLATTYFPAYAVASAKRGLTAVFGMGTGGSPSLWSPD